MWEDSANEKVRVTPRVRLQRSLFKRNNSVDHFSLHPLLETNQRSLRIQNVVFQGGKWVMTLQKEDASRMDDLWELLLLSMIGEYLDDGAGDNSKDGHSQVGCELHEYWLLSPAQRQRRTLLVSFSDLWCRFVSAKGRASYQCLDPRQREYAGP